MRSGDVLCLAWRNVGEVDAAYGTATRNRCITLLQDERVTNDFLQSIEAVPFKENAPIVTVLLGSDLVSVWDGKFSDLHGWQSSNAILIDSAWLRRE